MRIIDITATIRPGLVTWENSETAIDVEWLSTIAHGESCNLSRVTLGSHPGTHLDAPLHFLENAGTVDELDLNDLIGPCIVVELPHDYTGSITPKHCDSIPKGTVRVLFKTSNTHRGLMRDSKFHTEFTAFTPESACWLVEHGVRTVGIDYLSVASPSSGVIAETHRVFLDARLVLLEGLLLDGVQAGNYQLIALPLKIAGAEGCPIRAVLIDQGAA